MRRALVIGAETGELSGVHNDAATMTALLEERGFVVDGRTAERATQVGIRDGYERLIADSQDGDSAVVYFSGHGGLARVVAPSGIALPELQFIVPTDYDTSRPGDFRGITAVELSVLLARLTERTHNVAVILDCCHASHMSRDPGFQARALPHPTYLDIAEQLGALRAQGLRVDLPDPENNPYAVRLVACAPWESAYEYTNSHGARTGILTESLSVALREAGPARVSWAILIHRVRDRVTKLAYGQRPEVEGPSHRMLFESEEAPTGVTFTVVRARPDRLTLPGAALLGVAPGDQFGITPVGVPASDSTIVARATVKRTDGVTVQADFELCDGHQELPALAEAHPLVTSATRSTVLVRGSGPLAERVRAAVDAVPTLRATAAEDPVANDPVLAQVEVGGALSLWDRGTEPLVSTTADQAGIRRLVANLTRLSRAATLRRLAPTPGEELAAPFTVEWGRVVEGKTEPLHPNGAQLYVGESVYLLLRNDGERDLYFFVFDIGVSGAVTLIAGADPSGLRLQRKQEYVVGQRYDGTLVGSELVWPDGVPTDGPRPESVLVIVTEARQDLAALVQEGAKATRSSSPLQQLLAAATSGATREWAVAADPVARYAVRRLDCELTPAPAPVPETARFLVDERPDMSMRLAPRRLVSRAATPGTVAVRLTELVVQRNRSWGGASVRVDGLVLTGGGNGMPVYRAQTAHFSRIRDGERLPLDNMLVYHGPAVDFLDLAWWVTRDRRDSRALSDLLRDRLTDEDVLHAVGSLSTLVTSSPHAAMAATAVSACAVVVNTAYELLSTTVGDSIGLYRTSLLANEGFGVGRHPVVGTQPAQDFSFAYEVVATG